MPLTGIAPPAPANPVAKEFALFKVGEPSKVLELMMENLGNDGLNFSSLTSVTWPTAIKGTPAWQIDMADGPKAVAEVPCVILRYRDGRLFWGASFAESDGSPPACVSEDKIVGVGKPGGECAKCPLNEWGSHRRDDGTPTRGKACQERRRLFVMTPWSLLPVHFNIPPTSLKPIQQYFAKLVGLGLPYYSVMSKMRLNKAPNKDGVEYAELSIEMMARLGDDEIKVFRAINRQFDGVFATTSVVPPAPAPAKDESAASAAAAQARTAATDGVHPGV